MIMSELSLSSSDKLKILDVKSMYLLRKSDWRISCIKNSTCESSVEKKIKINLEFAKRGFSKFNYTDVIHDYSYIFVGLQTKNITVPCF